MRLLGYMSLLSTYRPAELGSTEQKILYYFVETDHASAYDVFKDFSDEFSNSIAYKNIHKRIKRLEQLNLIEIVDENFERGAKHYKITPYGLTTFLSNFISENPNYIQLNKHNILIKSLLLEYFEEETIDSFYTLKDDNTREISNYLSDCCSLIKNTCSTIWNEIEKYNIKDILPEDKIMQKYMIYLDKRPIEDYVLKSIDEYERKFLDKIKKGSIPKDIDLIDERYLSSKYHFSAFQTTIGSISNINNNDQDFQDSIAENNNDNVSRKYTHGKDFKDAKDPTKRTTEPPFPFNYVYSRLDYLDYQLFQKIRSLALSLVNMIGYYMEVYAPEYEERIKKYIQEKESIDNQQNKYEKRIKMNLEIIELSKKRVKHGNINDYEKNKALYHIRLLEEETRLLKKNIDPDLEGKRPIDLILDNFGRDYSMRRMMEDRKLLELVKDIKKLFDLGYEQFIKLSK